MAQDHQAIVTALQAAIKHHETELARLQSALSALTVEPTQRPAPLQAAPRVRWDGRRQWTPEQKDAAVLRAWGARGVGPSQTTRELQITLPMLYRWRNAGFGGVR